MLMTHPSFASAGMASSSDTVRSSTGPTPSPNAAQSNSRSAATLANGTSAPSSNATNGHSSSLSSLFERVTNFRRSLIKNQAKSKHKSATRPVSGTFSFFNGKALQEQNGLMVENSVSSASLMLEQFSNHSPPEDEIYGFTAGSTASLRLRMQRLNLSMGSQNSPPLSSPSSLTPSSPPSQLYETIDETKKSVQQAPKTMMDPARPLPALPIEHVSQSTCSSSSMPSPPIQSCSLNKSSPPKSTSYLRAKQSSNAMSNRHQNRYYTSGAISASLLPGTCSINSSDDDWKRNRRSSAIIFGTDFSSDLVDPNDSNVSNGQKQFAHLNRSSDDLLLASRSTSHTDHKGIYENLRSSRPKFNSGIREDRKLTKDSGYESASTLVNVGMQNSNAIQKAQQNGFFVNKSNIQPHSRSDSIDSNNSLDLYQPVEPRAFDSAFTVRTTDIDSVDDSPPPTPPIRYSSLVQNRVRQCSRMTTQSQESSHSSHSSHFSHSHHQHHHHHKHLKQDSIVSLVSSGSGGSQASSHSSASNSIASSSSLFIQTPNPVINNFNNNHHQQQQQTYSRNNVQYGPQQNSMPNDFISSQPVNYRMVEVLPSSPPPPLPPKNRILTTQANGLSPNNKDNKDQPIVNDIKAIQKKAVYEFYLRQKEKKLKEKENSPLKLTPTSPMSTVDYSEKFELPPLPPPEMGKWSTEEEDEEFPPPPTPLDKSVDYLSSLTTESEITSPLSPPPPPLSSPSEVNQPNFAQSQIYRGIDLSTIWPNIDFSSLLNLRPPVKESDLDIEDDGDEVDEELAGIERAHKSQLEANWQQSQLEAIRLAAETEMNSNEKRHEALFKLEQAAKLKSLCGDVTMISRLLVSIVGQLTVQNSSGNESGVVANNVAGDCDGTVNAAESDTISDDSIEVNSRRTRLLGQLEDAKRLRDNIDTRRAMFVARIERHSLALSSTSCSSTDLTQFASADPSPAAQSLGSQLADYLSTRERTLVLAEFVALLSNANTK